MKTIITDGGRSTSSHKNEKLDCTVRAYALALGISYDYAHVIMKSSGRKDRHRFGSNGAYTSRLGKSFKRSGTVGKFAKDNPTGRFLIQIRDHVFAMVEGLAYDMQTISLKSYLASP